MGDLVEYREVVLVHLDAELRFNEWESIFLADGKQYLIAGHENRWFVDGYQPALAVIIVLRFHSLKMHADQPAVLLGDQHHAGGVLVQTQDRLVDQRPHLPVDGS